MLIILGGLPGAGKTTLARALARRIGALHLRIDVRCANAALHRQRVEGRAADIPGHRLPSWAEITARPWEPWPAALIVDSGDMPIEAACDAVIARLAA